MIDVTKVIVLNKGKILQNILEIEYISNEKKYKIKLGKEKIYNYNEKNLEIFTKYEELDIQNYLFLKNQKTLSNIKRVLIFSDKCKTFYKILFMNGSYKDYHSDEIKIIEAYKETNKSKNIISYFRKVSELVSIKALDESSLLLNKINKIKVIRSDLVVCNYLNPENYSIKREINNFTIFPFGCNKGQFKAVNEALSNQLSVIKGPPGTGKTQTILNIMANLLLKNKTMLIASNNNSAVDNIYEKMQKNSLDFLIAYLGKSENKDKFINNQKESYDVEQSWFLTEDEINKITYEIINVESKLQIIFNLQEEHAKIFGEIENLKVEYEHFTVNAKNILNKNDVIKENILVNVNIIAKLLNKISRRYSKNKDVGFFTKLRIKKLFKVERKYLSHKNTKIQKMIEVYNYKRKLKDLNEKYINLDNKLNSCEVKKLLKDYTKLSEKILRSKVYNFANNTNKPIFSKDDLWKKPNKIIEKYPIVLSSTFSATSSLGKDVIYDYVIIDEASQVDVVTGFLALSIAKSAVIVGDEKQLGNIVEKKYIEKLKKLKKSFEIEKFYDYRVNNFLESVAKVVTDVPITLLKEHYRCNYKIINFCNQMFYDNELICMNTSKDKNSIEAFITVKGNHARGLFNLREVEVIKDEILTNLKITNENDIGIIAPYVKQCALLREKISLNCVKDTVHKFQGRENDIIILSTTSNNINKFVDDKQLINVAVSRAKNKFILVTNGNEIKKDSNIGYLLKYIKHNNCIINESKISSAFDYLYKQYESERISYLAKHKLISKFDSENVIAIIIRNILKKEKFKNLNFAHNVRFSNVINKYDNLTKEEEIYAKRPGTHCDFIIYSKITKEIILVIEVDGESFHKKFSEQYYRDLKKNSILEKNNMPYIRLSTLESREEKRIIEVLSKAMEE